MVEAAQSFESRRRVAGTRLGKYEVGKRIGSGGSASVYLARMMGAAGDERIAALKVVHEHLSEENDFISQFLDEANLLVRLTHPNIVQVYELGREGDVMYLAMEYLHGQPLNKLVSALSRRGGRIPPELVAWVGARLSDALAYAHGLTDKQGKPLRLVHRDVSPQNVFITYEGQVKLIDFGIARAARRIAQTTMGRVKGKFSYMAPEQVLGRSFDHRADLFALGATLHEAAAGARLFTGSDSDETIQNVLFGDVPDLRTCVDGFPALLAETLNKSLAAEPEDRFQSGSEMAAAFEECLTSCAAEDLALRLGALICRACERERHEMQSAIDSLRSDAERSAAPTLPAPPASKGPPGRARRGPVRIVAAAALLAAAGAGVLFFRQGEDGSAQTNAPAPSVAIEVSTHPDVDARITVGGEALQGKPARLLRARGESAVDVVVEAPGYESARLSVVPDRDRSVSITLVKAMPLASGPVGAQSGEPSASATASSATVAPRPLTGHTAASSKPTPSAAAAASASAPSVPNPTPTQSAPLHL